MTCAIQKNSGAHTPLFKASSVSVDETAQLRLETATSLLDGWVWETDRDHRFTYCSDNIETFTERPPEWHYGKTRQQIGNVCDEQQQKLLVEKLKAREPFRGIEFSRSVGNGVIHMRSAGQPFYRDGGFKGYQGVAYCISAEAHERRLRQESELKRLETVAAFKEVVALFPNAIVIFDAQRRVAFANQQYVELLSMREAEVAAHRTLEALVETLALRGELVGASAEDIVNRHVALANSGKAFKFERSRPDGSILRVEGFPLPCGGSVRVFTDVTSQAEDKWTIGALKEKIKQLSGRDFSVHQMGRM